MLLNPAILLMLGGTVIGGAIVSAPWGWSKWMDIMGIDQKLWTVMDPKSKVRWTASTTNKVAEYAWAFRRQSKTNQANFAKAKAKRAKNQKKRG